MDELLEEIYYKVSFRLDLEVICSFLFGVFLIDWFLVNLDILGICYYLENIEFGV